MTRKGRYPQTPAAAARAALLRAEDSVDMVELARWTPAGFGLLAIPDFEIPPHIDLINRKLIGVATGKIKRLMIHLPPRNGKALEVHTPIPTPRGWTEIGQLQPGDTVFAETGAPCQVVAATKPWGNRQLYRVVADDGTEVLADADHLWKVRLCEKRSVFKIHPTTVLAKRRSKRAMITRQGALRLPEADLPIPPYVLGVWLGDGCCREAVVSASGEDGRWIRERVERTGVATRWRASGKDFGLLGVHVKLRTMGLLDHKHIPMSYLRASEAQRLALLQGLVDTDGYVSEIGQVEICTIYPNLALEMQELVFSLGRKASISVGRARLKGKDYGPKYRVMFYMAGAASLPRKAARCRDVKKTPNRYVKARPAGLGDTVCIQVDNPSGMFLCGPGMLPTHNSWMVDWSFPSWYLGWNPDKWVMLTAYGSRFAEGWGRRVRETLRAYGPKVWGVAPRKDIGTADSWEMEKHGGGMKTAGVGGDVTGRGGNLVIIDDPVKSGEEAVSTSYQERTWEWYRSTVVPRQEPEAAIILVMTRWHENDLAGKILSQSREEGKEWDVVSLPALAEDDDPLGREPGDALWPERFSREWLLGQKADMAEFWWNAEYQQHPVPPEGSVFPTGCFHEWTVLPSYFDTVILSMDCSFTDKISSSYAVIQAWGTRDANLYLLDQWRDRVRYSGARDALRRMATKFPLATAKLIEETAGGFAILDDLKHEVGGLIPIPVPGKAGGKLARARAIEPLIKAGNVWVPSKAMCPWVDAFLIECQAFNRGQHDDQVDAMTQALGWLRKGTRAIAAKPSVWVEEMADLEQPAWWDMDID